MSILGEIYAGRILAILSRGPLHAFDLMEKLGDATFEQRAALEYATRVLSAENKITWRQRWMLTEQAGEILRQERIDEAVRALCALTPEDQRFVARQAGLDVMPWCGT